MFDYAPLQAPDESALRDVLCHALNIPRDYWSTFVDRIDRRNLRALIDKGTVIGGLGIYRMGQWFSGRVVPCGGISIVGIAPQRRREGAARFQLQRCLEELHADGTPLAALYASSQAVYRSVGFEQGGSRCEYELPITNIRLDDREAAIREVSIESPAPFEHLHRRRSAIDNGLIERTHGLWQRILHWPGCHSKPQQAYMIGDTESPEGYLISFHTDGGSEPVQIIIRDWCAVTPRAGRRLWTLLADHGSIVESVRWHGPPADPMLAHVAECKHTQVKVNRWMLRIVDVGEALRARGYLPGVEEELHLEVIDELLPANTGRYVLTVGNATADVSNGGRGDLRCTIRGLAPLYTGFLRPEALARLGWLEGEPPVLQAAARIFCGPEPWMPEIF